MVSLYGFTAVQPYMFTPGLGDFSGGGVAMIWESEEANARGQVEELQLTQVTPEVNVSSRARGTIRGQGLI